MARKPSQRLDINARTVERAIRESVPGAARYDITDTKTPGLTIQVGPQGGVWHYRYQKGKTNIRFHLGALVDWSAVDAREIATDAAAHRRLGGSIDDTWFEGQLVKRGKKEATVVSVQSWDWESARDLYLAAVEAGNKPKTFISYRNRLKNGPELQRFVGRQVATITLDEAARAVADILVAKRKFYDACRDVADLKGIGFSRSPTFPIKRSDFQRISKIPEGAAGEDWIVTIENIISDSPNWRRLDKSRSWKGTDQNGHARYFTIRDELFWEMVSRRELPTRIADSMKVQWAYVQGPKGPKRHTVLRVLEFNGVNISPAMSDREIRPILDSFVSVKDMQTSLFDND